MRSLVPSALALTLIAAAGTPRVSAEATATLSVDVGHTTASINRTQWGHIVEDINHSVEGGLYANVVRNSNMKEEQANPPAYWSLVTGGGGTGSISLDTTQPLNAANGNALKLTIDTNGPGQRVGAANAGFYGVGVHPSTTYLVSLFAKSDGVFNGPLNVDIESTTGAIYAGATIPAISGTWEKYVAWMTTDASAPDSANNRFVVSANGVGAGSSVWLNIVQCFPPTYDDVPNGIRPDLESLFAQTHPGFFRVPGGNYLEGDTLATRFDWKSTIGPVEARPGHQNDAWGYWSTDGFGLLNYLLMAEQAGAEPLIAVYAGYSLRGYVVPQSELGPYVQDALDEIQYITGDINTTWGAKRAADGHPDPFPLHYVEIGNEDSFDRSGSYNTYRYPMFYDAIKAEYPLLQVVASAGVTSRPMDVIDDHYYNREPSFFTNNAHRYDGADRNGPKVLVGEYAVTNAGRTNPTGNLAGALGEAGFMTGLARNADIVIGASYAPALTSVDNWQWSTNLIGFNAVTSYGSPSYYVQQMFGTSRGDYVVPTTMTGAATTVSYVATRSADGGDVYLTLVNPTAAVLATQVAIIGATKVAQTATVTTLTGDPSDANSITNPTAVVPTTSEMSVSSKFDYAFPANSVTVIRLSTKGEFTPLLVVDRGLSLQSTTPGSMNRSVRHQDGLGVTDVITTTSSRADRQAASLYLRSGLASSACYSFESRDFPGSYLRQSELRVRLDANDGTDGFAADATFCATPPNNGLGVSWKSFMFQERYLRQYNHELWISEDGGDLPWDTRVSWADDTSWWIGLPWWRSDVDLTTGGFQSLQATSPGFTNYYLRHRDSLGWISKIDDLSSELDKMDSTFKLIPGLADSSCYSFESRNFPGNFLRHSGFRIRLNPENPSSLYRADATFCAQPGNSGQGLSFQSYNYTNLYLRHYDNPAFPDREVWIAANGFGPRPSDTANGWADDTSWLIADPWAP